MKGTLKKSLSIVLSFMLIAAASTSMIASAAGDFTIENGVLTKYTGTAASVAIPDEVTAIGYNAFRDCTTLASVTIPSSVTSIGSYAFGSCTSLTGITIPDSVTSIDDCAFYSCTSLTSAAIGSGVSNMGYFPFTICTNLSTITVSPYNKTYTSVNNVLFDKTKTQLMQYPLGNTETSYTIPSNVIAISLGAFACATHLTSVTIPGNVAEIGTGAFLHCTNLANVTIQSSNTLIDENAFTDTAIYNNLSNWVNNVLYIDHFLIKANTALSGSYAVEPNTRCIASQAFKNTGLTSATIPSSVTSIGVDAFNDTPLYNDSSNWVNNVLYIDHCLIKAKTSISGSYTIEPNTQCIAGEAFEDCTGLTGITIPNSVTSIDNSAFDNCSGLTSITIPNSVTLIGYSAFSGCSGLTSLTIPSSVTSIDCGAFGNCSGLTSITIPSSVTSIGMNAFCACSGLTSITIPSSVTSIGPAAFVDCTNLTNITIPSGVTSIGYAVFYGCTKLANITVDQNNLNYSSNGGVLFNKDQTALVYYPDGRTETSYTIPNSVTSINDFAFMNFTHLANVTIPNTVTGIEGAAFYSDDLSNFALYCTANSAAYSYAVATQINYTIVNITPADKAVIDYPHHRIYSDHRPNTSISDLVAYTASGLTVRATASYTEGGISYYGTGSVIKLYNGNTFVASYTVIVYGDLNGDSVCDSVDVSMADQFRNGSTPSQIQLAAANVGSSGIFDDAAYQFVVSKSL